MAYKKQLCGIKYVDTWHRCNCQCGEVFFVNVSDVYMVKPDSVSTVAVRCPICKWEAFLWHHLENPDLITAGRANVIPGERLQGRNDIYALERIANLYRERLRDRDTKLSCLQAACRRVLNGWKDVSKSARMADIKTLSTVLKETEPTTDEEEQQ